MQPFHQNCEREFRIRASTIKVRGGIRRGGVRIKVRGGIRGGVRIKVRGGVRGGIRRGGACLRKPSLDEKYLWFAAQQLPLDQ